MKLAYHRSSSQRPPLHISSSSLDLNIVNALELAKCKRRSKFDHTKIDSDNIVVHDVKYLPSYFNDDVFVNVAPSVYGYS